MFVCGKKNSFLYFINERSTYRPSLCMRLQIFFIYSNVFIFDISFDLRKKKKQTKREFHENKDEVKEPENMGISEDRSTLKKP